MFPALGPISGGAGGIGYSPSATSGSDGGNSHINIGGFNVPEYPQAFGLPGAAGVAQSLVPLVLVGLAVAGAVWVLARKK